MSGIEQVDELLSRVAGIRAILMEERQALLTKLEKIDTALDSLPGSEKCPRPISLHDWRRRRRILSPTEIGREGQPINSRDIIHVTAVFFGTDVAKLVGQQRFAS